jgi:hypothetical protein
MPYKRSLGGRHTFRIKVKISKFQPRDGRGHSNRRNTSSCEDQIIALLINTRESDYYRGRPRLSSRQLSTDRISPSNAQFDYLIGEKLVRFFTGGRVARISRRSFPGFWQRCGGRSIGMSCPDMWLNGKRPSDRNCSGYSIRAEGAPVTQGRGGPPVRAAAGGIVPAPESAQ